MLPSLGRRRGGMADRALCAQQADESDAFFFSFIITKSCRYFFLAGDTRNLPRAVPRSLGHPPWPGDAHPGDERLLAIT
jgi:hypothetical protein